MSDLTDDPLRLSPDDIHEALRARTSVLKDRDYRTRLRREALQAARCDLTPAQRRWRRYRRVLRRYGLCGRLWPLLVAGVTGAGLALLMTGWRR